jgi:nucleoid-associated protein YgaU
MWVRVRVGVRLAGAFGALVAVAMLLLLATPAGFPATPSEVPRRFAAAPVETQVASLATLAAWGCLAWLAYVLLAVAVGVCPRGAVRDLAPLARRVLGLATAGVAAGALVAATPPALADGPFDRPADHPAHRRPRAGTHVVAPGDTLWGIAARRLGASASPALTAATWPRWYAANRPRIGPDPGLILPGQRLRPPPDDGGAR